MYSSTKRALCSSIREGMPCLFMIKDVGCSFNDNYCRPTIPSCKGEEKNCSHIILINNKEYCDTYMHPEAVWKHKHKCPLETHLPRKEEKKTITLNTRKAAKQRRRQF